MSTTSRPTYTTSNNNGAAAAGAAPRTVPLQSLPLRPTTLSLLLRNGFQTTDDVRASRRSGGVSNLAAELGNVGLSDAETVWREVEDAASGVTSNGTPSSGPRPAASASGTCSTRPTAGGRHIRARSSTTSPANTSSVNPRVTAASLLLAPGAGSGGGAAAVGSLPPATQRHIVTFCRSIDSLLGGGIALSELSEISGAPGAGKTQLAMQVCVDARLPRAFGGVQGEAVYMDSEGSFSSERCLDMAESLVRHVQRSAERRARGGGPSSSVAGAAAAAATTGGTKDDCVLPQWFNPTEILAGIHVIRVHDVAAQVAAIRNLPALLQARRESGTPVRAVVVDSVAFHYRASPAESGSSYGSRTRNLTRLAASLSDLARDYDVAVVAVNQMTTKVGAGPMFGTAGCQEGRHGDNLGGYNDRFDRNSDISSSVEGTYSSSRLVPALGESWSHSITTRLLLTQLTGGSGCNEHDGEKDIRQCRLLKCPHRAAGVASFLVTGVGIRDVAGPLPTASQPPQMHSTELGIVVGAVGGMKRQRVQ